MAEKKVLGVCKWLSYKFELDISGIRLLFIVATILGFGSPIFIYLILYLIMPKPTS
jgi:phage shock protein C